MKLEQLYKEVNLIDFDLPCLVYRKCSPGLSKMQSAFMYVFARILTTGMNEERADLSVSVDKQFYLQFGANTACAQFY